MADCSSHRTRRPPTLLLVFLLAAASAISVSNADSTADQKECQDQLVQLEPCLPYVSKQGPKPTPDCCSSMKQVLSKSLRCVCILIKDKDEPFVKNYRIDLDRALSIPTVCAINASVSECPKLLNLTAGSPEAKMFQDVEGRLHGNSSTPGSAPATITPGTSSSGGGGVRRHYYAGMGSTPGWLGGGLSIYTSVATLVLVAIQGA